MPYIDKNDREHLDEDMRNPETPGELNYQLTRLVTNYIFRLGISYTTFNEAIGVLECAKQELYRRMIAPYEDKKCKINGDVYT